MMRMAMLRGTSVDWLRRDTRKPKGLTTTRRSHRLLLCAAERDTLHSLRRSHLLATPPDGLRASASACALLTRVPQTPSELARLALIRSVAGAAGPV